MKRIFKLLTVVVIGLLMLAIISFFILNALQEPISLEEAQAEASGDFVELPDGITHYTVSGENKKGTIIFIHGGMVSGMKAWDKNVNAFSEAGYEVVRYDLYGRGYSARPKQAYTPELFFNQLDYLIDSLQLSPPYQLVAISMGCMVAANYAAKHPTEVEKLVMLSPAVLGKYSGKWPLKIPVLREALMTFYWFPQAIESQMEEFHAPEKNQEYKESLEEMVRIKGYKESNISTWFNTLNYSMEPELAQIASLHIPTLILFGQSDPYLSSEDEKIYHDLLPEATIETLPEVGHVLSFEAPARVNQRILNFLEADTLATIVM